MPSPAPDGLSVIGKYDIEGRLGQGGMGDVYLGKHQLLGRPAAIKVLKPKYAKRRELTERFFREARIAAALRHPSVVEVYDFGYADDGSAYLAMELLEGEDLRARLRTRGPLPVSTAVEYARQLLSVLAVAHREGIVHRDLKPENIFIISNSMMACGEEIKLLDFGVAKLAADLQSPSLTQTGQIIGTPTYMAPEQCQATGDYDGRTDLYALGCIIYEMVTGKPPFIPSGRTQEIYLAHLGTPAPRLGKQAADLDAVVARLLQKEPEDRFDSAEQVLAVLDRLGDPGATQVALAPRMTGRVSPLEAETLGPAQLAARGGVELRTEEPASQAAATLDLKPSKPATVDIGPSQPGTVNLRPKSGSATGAKAGTGSEGSTGGEAEPIARAAHKPAASESTLDALARPPRAARWPWIAAGGIVVAGVIAIVVVSTSGGESSREPPTPGTEPAAAVGTEPAAAPSAAAVSDAGAPDAPAPTIDAGPQVQAPGEGARPNKARTSKTTPTRARDSRKTESESPRGGKKAASGDDDLLFTPD